MPQQRSHAQSLTPTRLPAALPLRGFVALVARLTPAVAARQVRRDVDAVVATAKEAFSEGGASVAAVEGCRWKD